MKNKVLIFTIVIMLLLANLTFVQAATTATATLKADKQTVKPGDTFTVTLSVACEDGINGIDTTYTYDTSKLELVSANLKDSSKWSNLGADNQITIICNSTSKITTSDILVLTFKVKDTATNGATAEISTADILVDSDAATDSEKTVKSLKATITVKTESTNQGNQSSGEGTGTEQGGQGNTNTEPKPETPGNTTPEDTTPGNTTPENTTHGNTTQGNTTQTNTQESGKTNTSNTDKTVTKVDTLPKTGKSVIALVIGAILVVVGVITYKKYDMYKGI